MWPVLEFHDEDSGFTGYYLSPTGEAHWKFLVNPMDWMVVSASAQVFNDQIFMVMKSKETLLRFFFADVSLHKNVTVADLQILSGFFKLDVEETKRLKRVDLIHKLVRCDWGPRCRFHQCNQVRYAEAGEASKANWR